MRRLVLLFAILFSSFVVAQNSATNSPNGEQVVEQALPSVGLVLVGTGDGQLAGVASCIVVRADGVVLTAAHAVKGMREVQIRLKNGDIYDNVELVATDERRDVAALRISATGLRPVTPIVGEELKPGANVFVISNGAALPWSVSAGVLSSVRRAEEVSGAGTGYRILQFTAPVAPGSSGGLLLDTQGRALGIVVGALSEGQNQNFAVPIDSVMGLASATGGSKLGSGAALQMPNSKLAGKRIPEGQKGAASTQEAREISGPPLTVNIMSKTVYLRRERLQEQLASNVQFKDLGYRFADYGDTANIGITVDRPFMTFDWTYVIVQQPEGLLLASGMIEAEDEYDAAPRLAAVILQELGALRYQGMPSSVLAAAPPRSPRSAAAQSIDESSILRTFKKMYVESHTIYLKGHQLQDAIYIRPELKDWGIKIVDDKSEADVWVDITRPFLTFDWVYTITCLKSGRLLAKGKVIAWDGPIAAPQLAVEIVKDIRNARPLPTAGE